jgi:sugar lactone lactonase YvrE
MLRFAPWDDAGMRNKLLIACLALAFAGCSSSTSPVFPIVTGGGGGTPGTHLYVGDDSATGRISQFSLPLTAASVPTFTITGAANNVSIGLDAAGHIAVGDFAGHLAYVGTLPLSASSTPTATFNNGAAVNAGAIAFTSAGSMYVSSTGANVYGYTSPFSNASVPSTTTTAAGLTSAIGLAFDAAGNMYVGNAGGAGSNIYVFAPPYTGAPTVVTTAVAGTAYRKLALNSTQLFVANVGGTGGIYVYTLPLTAASVPAFIIPNAQDPEGIAVDSSGNLYSGNLNNSTVTVYSPPFSAASVPATTVTVAGYAIFGIAIGL